MVVSKLFKPFQVRPWSWAGTVVGLASSGVLMAGEPRIVAPADPLPRTCFTMDTATHSGAFYIEEIEGEAIDGLGYGNVRAETGESWSYWFSVLGELDGAFLSVNVSTVVEGSATDEAKQWAFVEGGIVTDMGTYAEVDCEQVDRQILSRITG